MYHLQFYYIFLEPSYGLLMVLKFLLFTPIHHSNILMKCYTMLVKCFLFQICQMFVCVHMELLILHVKVSSEILKREAWIENIFNLTIYMICKMQH